MAKGMFKPKNPSKYKGDPTNIVWRSSWECVFFSRLDNDPNVIQWSSEEIIINYKSPIDSRIHRYFPDCWVKKKNPDTGKITETLIEIKPKAQTKAPSVQKKPTKKYINEVQTWGINNAKWEAAESYCKAKGWDWIIMTEDHLGLNKPKLKTLPKHKPLGSFKKK